MLAAIDAGVELIDTADVYGEPPGAAERLAALAVMAGAVGGVHVYLVIAALTAIVSGAGLWITHGHIEDFRKQLR